MIEYSVWMAATGCNGMRPAYRARTRLGQSEMKDLAGLDQVFHRPGHVLDRYRQVDPVLIVEIDAIGLQPPQRLLDHAPDAFRPAVESDGSVDRKAELGRKDDLVADRRKRFADELLVRIGTVDFGRIEEGDAPFVGFANDPQTLIAASRRTVIAREASAQPKPSSETFSPPSFLVFRDAVCAYAPRAAGIAAAPSATEPAPASSRNLRRPACSAFPIDLSMVSSLP